MAKKGFPGLVVVPPSDRTILKRRIVRWGLFAIALVWSASTFINWPPASDETTNCEPAVGQDTSGPPSENCDQPQQVAQIASEGPPPQSEFSLTQPSQAEGLTDQHSVRVPIAERDPPTPQPDPKQDTPTPSTEQTSAPRMPSDRTAAAGETKKVVSSPSTPKPTSVLESDTRLAEQGDAFAQYRLGRHYAQQNGRQTPEATHWYKKASKGLHRLAETGNGQAMYVLGVMYAFGRGVTKDAEQARRWLAQAVEQKITAAQPVLANLQSQPNTNSKPQVSAQNNR
jgi:uncharacterized protein